MTGVLGLILDFKLDFYEHMNSKVNSGNKIIKIILSNIVFDKPFNKSSKS